MVGAVVVVVSGVGEDTEPLRNEEGLEGARGRLAGGEGPRERLTGGAVPIEMPTDGTGPMGRLVAGAGASGREGGWLLKGPLRRDVGEGVAPLRREVGEAEVAFRREGGEAVGPLPDSEGTPGEGL